MESEVGSCHWDNRICPLLGFIVHQQRLWNTMVYVIWRDNLWYLGSLIILACLIAFKLMTKRPQHFGSQKQPLELDTRRRTRRARTVSGLLP
jgi:hypothetical protein